MINYKELKIVGYLKKDYREILIKYEDIEEIIEFEKYQSEGVLKTLDSYLKEFYKTGNKSILKSIFKAVQINKDTFYRIKLPDRLSFRF